MTPRPYRSCARAQAADATRRRLIVSAAEVLGATGAAAFSLESVARAGGVARVTVYNQFGSRRGLLEAVFDDLALRGGLPRLREAMTEPDPFAAIDKLVEVFCAFWRFDPLCLGGLQAAAAGDPELNTALRERNERRRKALGVLVERLADSDEIRASAAVDLTDLLFVLTSFQTYSDFVTRRTPQTTCELVKRTVRGAVREAAKK